MSWGRLEGTDGRLFGTQPGREGYRSGCVVADLKGRTADCLVGIWVGEISCWVSWARLDATFGRLFGSQLGVGDIVLGELGQI